MATDYKTQSSNIITTLQQLQSQAKAAAGSSPSTDLQQQLDFINVAIEELQDTPLTATNEAQWTAVAKQTSDSLYNALRSAGDLSTAITATEDQLTADFTAAAKAAGNAATNGLQHGLEDVVFVVGIYLFWKLFL